MDTNVIAIASVKSTHFRVTRQDVYLGDGLWSQVHEVQKREGAGPWDVIHPASLHADTSTALGILLKAKARAELDACIARYMDAPASNEPAEAYDAVELAVGVVR